MEVGFGVGWADAETPRLTCFFSYPSPRTGGAASSPSLASSLFSNPLPCCLAEESGRGLVILQQQSRPSVSIFYGYTTRHGVDEGWAEGNRQRVS